MHIWCYRTVLQPTVLLCKDHWSWETCLRIIILFVLGQVFSFFILSVFIFEQLFAWSGNDRTKGNGLELKEGKIRLDVKKKLFTQRWWGTHSTATQRTPISGGAQGQVGWALGSLSWWVICGSVVVDGCWGFVCVRAVPATAMETLLLVSVAFWHSPDTYSEPSLPDCFAVVGPCHWEGVSNAYLHPTLKRILQCRRKILVFSVKPQNKISRHELRLVMCTLITVV